MQRRFFLTATASLLMASGFLSTPVFAATRVMDTDLVIVGGGLSGIAAAAEATDKRLKPVVLEKLAILGGAGNLPRRVARDWHALPEGARHQEGRSEDLEPLPGIQPLSHEPQRDSSAHRRIGLDHRLGRRQGRGDPRHPHDHARRRILPLLAPLQGRRLERRCEACRIREGEGRHDPHGNARQEAHSYERARDRRGSRRHEDGRARRASSDSPSRP